MRILSLERQMQWVQGPEKYSLCLRNTKFIHTCIFELTQKQMNWKHKLSVCEHLEYLFFFLHFGIFGIFMLLYWTILCQFWTVNLTSILKSVFVKVWQPCNAMVRNDSINILTIGNNLYEFFKWCKTLLFI